MKLTWMTWSKPVAVWASLLLGGFGLIRHLVPRYRVGRPLFQAIARPVPVPVHSA